MKTVQPIRKESDIRNMKRALAAIHPKYEFMFTFGINTGLRISDIVGGEKSKTHPERPVTDGLHVRDVLGKTHVTIKEQKTGKTKRFLLNKEMQKIIKKYVKDMGLSDDDYLVPSTKENKDGELKAVTRIQAYRVLNEAAEECGLEEIGTHTLRKTFGYFFYRRTHDVALLMDIFNHSAPSITLRYIGITDKVKDEALEHFCL